MAGDPRPDDRPLEDRADGAAFEELLGSLNADLADVPEDVIERARRSGDELYSRGDQGIDQESGGAGRHERESSGQAIRVQVDASSENPRGNGRMILAARAVICVSAAVIAGVAVFLNSAGPVRGETTLGHVLDDAAAADSLHLKVIRGDSQADVLVAKSGRLRWEEHPTRYQIARGSTLWRIDESTNTATEEANPWFTKETDEELGIDLLSLLQVDELGDESIARLRKAGASRRLPYEGQLCDVFQLRTTAGSRKLIIEAYVNADSQQLRSIICRPYPPTDPDVPPIAEVRLLARDIPIDESKFKIASSLSEDGRIGKIVDSQGIVTLRTVMRRRWTPVARQTLLKPGDWLRTDLRGANASTVHLTSKFRVIAGPGTLLELQKPDQLLLHTGEVHITGSGKADESLTLHGPEGQKIAVKPGESVHYRVVPIGRLFKVKKKPKWLAGYDGSSNRESIGSLVANIDGRSMPLTVGFHKVKVEIRDQIARTTIEESFVNHTTRRLEGVFHFPLPQDASISGFGMWINGELIEADVVEKQRAREIYETILREKRDPGLLEWTGGNIFKARVFPIEPSAEKRIRIVYTQVLPLRANQYRYSYALRSEMLQKTPLRELSLNVLVHSALPLKSVDCPTHSVRTQSTRLSAQLEFAAQEYTPNRDFEVVCEVDAKQADVVMIPHRRGDDGYFLVQLSPPGREGNWQREILPDGNPLELLLVCDTSASMNSQNREQQQQFVASVLASLDEGDRFNVAVCDVDCHWLDDGWLVPGEGSSNRVRGWLDNRLSLGWTDLDRMTESVLEQVGAKTQVIYIGDGIVTAHDADPQGFVNRLRRLVADNSKPNASPPTFHTVSIGNSFESAVLKGLAETGGGSARQISGEQTPQRIALELLNEIAQPGLRDVRVEFRGIQAAAVYPERLPNLAAGTQQILVGRYLPQEGDHKGEIIVRGRRGGEDVQFSAPVSFKEAEQGNSFIPRLWARSQLDSLLEQGSSEFTKNAIIALSEEFHIITPYTSLLVLETDEDRERFGVKRRYQMRDGEQFFADGSEAARLKLKQQQMKRAGDWRIGLRRRVLYELSQLGRSTPQIQQVENELKRMSGYEALNSPFPNTASATQPVFTDGFSGGSDLYAFSSAIDSPRSAGSSGGEVNPVWALDAEFDMNGEGFKLARESDKFAEISDLSGKSSLLFDRQEMLVGLQSSPGSLETDASNGLFDFRKLASSRNQPIFGKRLSGERSRRIGGMGGNWSGYFNRGNLSNNQYTWWTSTLLPEILNPTGRPKRSRSRSGSLSLCRSKPVACRLSWKQRVSIHVGIARRRRAEHCSFIRLTAG